MLEGRPLIRLSCRQNLARLWSEHMKKRRVPAVWAPLPGFAVQSQAVMGVRRLEAEASQRIGFAAQSRKS
jgi:hypothetical protein